MGEWNIAGLVDQFASSGGTLDEIMNSLGSSGLNSTANFLDGDISQAVEVVSCTYAVSKKQQKLERSTRKTILRTSKYGNDSKVVSLKKVTFDVEKFAADENADVKERTEARERLAVRLGARPSKKSYVNYKELKKELNLRKNAEPKFDKLSALKALKKLSLKRKVKGKKSCRR